MTSTRILISSDWNLQVKAVLCVRGARIIYLETCCYKRLKITFNIYTYITKFVVDKHLGEPTAASLMAFVED